MDLLVPEVISLISKLGAMMVLIRAGFMSYCTECIDTHTCGTNVMMQLYCSRYLNNAYRFYWRSMRLCYPNPPFSQLAC